MWDNFYVIVGSSAGALIGLQFVVITLMADMPLGANEARASAAFATPTVVHFGFVLLLSAVLSMPWGGIVAAAVLWGVLGLGGVAYSFVVARRLRSQTVYTPVFEDLLFYLLLPCAAYFVLVLSAIAACASWGAAPFFVGAASLLLLFVGIHNAWDTVTYHVFVRRRERGQDRATPPKDSGPPVSPS
jgi:hypothetical protein